MGRNVLRRLHPIARDLPVPFVYRNLGLWGPGRRREGGGGKYVQLGELSERQLPLTLSEQGFGAPPRLCKSTYAALIPR